MNNSAIEENITFVTRAFPQLVQYRGGSPPSAKLIARANAHLQFLVNNAEIVRYDSPFNAEKILKAGGFRGIIEREAKRAAQVGKEMDNGDYTEKRQ